MVVVVVNGVALWMRRIGIVVQAVVVDVELQTPGGVGALPGWSPRFGRDQYFKKFK